MISLSRLKDYFRDAPIQSKLTWMIGATAVIALLFITITLSYREYVNQKRDAERDLQTIADIIAWNSGTTAAIKDYATAKHSLQALRNIQGIVEAYFYNSQGKVVATLKTDSSASGQLALENIHRLTSAETEPSNEPSQDQDLLTAWRTRLTNQRFELEKHPIYPGYSEAILYDQNGYLNLIRPLVVNDKLVATLHLVDDLSRLKHYLAGFYLLTVITLLLTLVAVFLISNRLQRIISGPVLKLMQAMRSVTQDKKFTGHLYKTTNDEFGQLVDVYNEMLEEIHNRDELLQWQRETLATQVKERTAELAKKNSELEQVATDALMAKDEAEAANKSKSQFLANMSHEIRTPLNSVLGMADFLANSELKPDQQRSAEVMKQSSTLLLRIINDILDFSKIESGKLNLSTETFNCRELLNESFDLLKLEAQSKGLKYRLQQTTEIPESLIGDPIRLSQILVNLLGNAIKFTAQGEVTLSVSCKSLADSKVRLYCEITDTGIGIDPNKLSLIFDAFSQADNTMTRIYQGTGLGLAISKQLIQLMNGQIGVNSQLGIGSTFWFWVDLKKSKTSSKSIKNKTNYRFKAKLLVAEDYPTNQMVVQRFLEDLGCTVELVNNGFEAVKAIKKTKYDLVFMDCQMPFMDGYQATQEIRQHEATANTSEHIPIIALTAHALTEDEAKCKEAGMDGWVTKPFTRQDLSKVLQKWLPQEQILADQPALPTDLHTLAKASNVIEDTTAINIEFFTRQFRLDNVDDLAFITSLTKAFQQNAAQTLSALQQSIDNEDAEQIRKLGHGLKSLSTNVGSGRLTELCMQMEQAGKDNNLKDTQSLLESMKQEYLRVLTELNALSSKV